MAYLDNTGLGTLWGRIKAYIASLDYATSEDIALKQDALVAGASINIQTNIVSKNLWNPTNSTNSSPGFNATSRTVASDGTISITNNSGNSASRVTEEHTAAELGLENGKVYTLTFYCDSMSTDTSRKNLLWVNGSYEQLNPDSGADYITITWTQTNNSKVQVGTIYFDNPVNGQAKSYKIQLEQGNVRTDYVAYNVGTQVPVISAVVPTVPTISTDISSDATSDTKTASPKAVKTFVEGKGYLISETYTGTVTGVKMNNGSAISPVNGIVDLGTVITEHQNLTNYVQKNQTSGLLKNDGTVDTTAYTTNTGTVTSTGGTVTVNNIQVVSELPASPDANTLYLIPE